MYHFWEAPLPKKFGRANILNLARFRTTFDFDRVYQGNRLRNRKLKTNVIDSDLWRFSKEGELGPLTNKLTI